jgi:hypothetical protein
MTTTTSADQLDLPLAAPAPTTTTPPFGDWNPRFVLWARSRGQSPDAFGRDADGDITRLAHEGGTMPWTVVFSFWIHDRWKEWATELGFTRGEHRHEVALRSGHTAAEFDAWLECHVDLQIQAQPTTPSGETR